MHPALPLGFVAARCCTATAGTATAGLADVGAATAPSSRATPAYRLQMPGDFHGDEPVARDGQRWLALRVDTEGLARLERARLRVSAVEDMIIDGPGETSGRRVQADGAESPAFLRGPALRSGPVDTAQVESLGLAGLPDARIAFAGTDHRLQTECAPFVATPGGAAEQSLPTGCRILLRRGRAQAVLMEAPATRFRSDDGGVYTSLGEDGSPHLLFAGGPGRDGQVGLLFDVSDHDYLQRPTRFLSGPAASGSAARDAVDADQGLPLGAVAGFDGLGC